MENLIDRVKFVCDEIAGADGFGAQMALGNAAGASKSVVNQWLAGKIKSMDINYALNIEKNLGYNHIWLMIGKGDRKLGPTSEAQKPAPRLDERAAALPHIPKSDSPLNADVLALLGFLEDDAAQLVRLFRAATPRGQKLILAAANNAPRLGLSAIVDNEAQANAAGTGDRNRL